MVLFCDPWKLPSSRHVTVDVDDEGDVCHSPQPSPREQEVNRNEAPLFYKFHVAALPDHLWRLSAPVEQWHRHCQSTTDPAGFPTNSLNRVHPIPWHVELERVLGITSYMVFNVAPFFLLIFLPAVAIVGQSIAYAKLVAGALLAYVLGLTLLPLVMEPFYRKHYQQRWFFDPRTNHDYVTNQYVHTERHVAKYTSLTMVWPQSLHQQQPNTSASSHSDTPLIFCLAPHGVASLGVSAYPVWSKLFNHNLCRWTIAPVVFNIPLISLLVRKVGYIPAKAPHIRDALARNENVGLVLDGIAGMFRYHSQSKNAETLAILQNKGIVKIALQAGVPLVPCFGFGHSTLWRVVVDPFGLLERISTRLNLSVVPFYGRWGWPLGPPFRVPVTVCLGDPIVCPRIPQPTQAEIDHYHKQLVLGFQQVFDQHKRAYGWADKQLKFV